MEREPGKASRRPLALTLGEPAGIGPDIAIEARQKEAEALRARVQSCEEANN